MKSNLTREQAFELFMKYNKTTFLVQHALTLEAMKSCEDSVNEIMADYKE